MTTDRAPSVNGDGLDDASLVAALRAAVRPDVAPSGDGCAECEPGGGWWVHLRRCATCGHVGCCDSSPAQHATVHYRETGHRVMRSFEPGEDWYWDFGTEQVLEGPHLAAPLSHPPEQTTPGPADRVPENWRELVHR
jgi:hypothetical protein